MIILIETILILLWINFEYLNTDDTRLLENQVHYSTHHAFHVVGNPILILKGMPINEKLLIWKESAIKDEMLSYFPNIELMKAFFKDRIEDNGQFKIDFLNYMQEQYDDYIGAIITKEEFITAISNPPPLMND